MMKLMKMTLVSAVLATGAMAGGDIPKTIELGATLYINNSSGLNGTVDNYGTITTENSSGNYPTVDYTTINNHTGQSFTAAEGETLTALKAANPVSGVTLDNVYTITSYTGTVENITAGEGSSVNTVTDASIDFTTPTATDLVHLGAESSGQMLTIAGGADYASKADIVCHFGDQGGDESSSYALKSTGYVDLSGDLSNYKNGKITNEGNLSISNTDIHVPMDSKVYGTIINCNLYGEINVTNGFSFYNSTLKSGAVLRIGAAQTE